MERMTRRALFRGSLSVAVAGTGPLALDAALHTALADLVLDPYTPRDVVDNGNRFFGSISRGLANVIEEAGRRWGRPNAYILGQEAGGALIGGLRYGEGMMYTRNAGDQRVYWQGPTVGLDTGIDGDRTMMLVYNLPATRAIYRRYGGVDGSAYVVGGVGFTALTNERVVLVPIRTGVGARFGVNVGYLKFTPHATWFPF